MALSLLQRNPPGRVGRASRSGQAGSAGRTGPSGGGVRDLRGLAVTDLVYPAGAVVLLAGVPGAGKSVLLRRLFGPAASRSGNDVVVLDSGDVRDRWAPRLRGLPYPWWRPLVHAAHYAAVLRAVAAGRSVVVHDSGTRPWVRRVLAAHAAHTDAELHVLLLDVDPVDAHVGQVTRGRRVSARSFATHCRRWRRLLDRAALGDPVVSGAVTTTVIDRCSAATLRRLRFTSAARPTGADRARA